MRRSCFHTIASVAVCLLVAPCGLHNKTVRAQSQGAHEEAQALALAREVLGGRSVVVRVYPNPQVEPDRATKVTIPLRGLNVDFEAIQSAYPGVSDSTMVLIQAEDQVDEAIAEVLGRTVYVAGYAEKRPLSLWTLIKPRSYSLWWTFLDARGEPMPNAPVEMKALAGGAKGAISLGRASLDDQGRLRRRILVGATPVFVVQHPNYGRAIVQYTDSQQEAAGMYVVPLVPLDSDDAGVSIQGIVTDNEGNPVPDVVVRCTGLDLPNGRHELTNQGIRSHVLTDEEGGFTLCMPILTKELELKGLPPAGTRYEIVVEPPKWANLRVPDRRRPPRVLAGTWTEIVLTPMEAEKVFHTFAFEYYEGPVTDPEELRQIELRLYRNGREWIKLGYEQIKDGYALPPGMLRARTRRWREEFAFQEIPLTADSPEHVVLRGGNPILYRGRVVEAATGEPMAGVFVLADHRFGNFDPCDLTDEHWQQLRAEAAEQAAADTVEALYRHRDRVAVTDADGFYDVAFRPGFRTALWKFTALEPGYRRASAPPNPRPPALDGVTKAPTLELEPAGPIYFPKFVFEDETGPVLDPNRLKDIKLTIKHPGNLTSSRRYGHFVESGTFVAGIYNAEVVWQRRRYTFEPVDLTESRPDVVVFKPRKIELADVVYQGQVLHGVTGRPLPGAVVILASLATKTDASRLEPAQWAAIKALGPDPQLTDPALVPLMDLFDSRLRGPGRLTLTDDDGWFGLMLPQAEIPKSGVLLVLEEGFLGASQQLQLLARDDGGGMSFREHEPDENGIVTLFPLKLFPAGTIVIHPAVRDPGTTPKRRERIRFRWRIPTYDNPAWVADLCAPPRDNHGAQTFHQYELTPNVTQTLYVPAGVELEMFVYQVPGPYPPIPVGRATLHQGQVLELGRIECEGGIKVVVKVTDSQGDPVTGIPVICCPESGPPWGGGQSTDRNGALTMYVPAHSTGRFCVGHFVRQTGRPVEESVPYEVGDEQDAGKEFLLQLSDEMIALLSHQRR